MIVSVKKRASLLVLFSCFWGCSADDQILKDSVLKGQFLEVHSKYLSIYKNGKLQEAEKALLEFLEYSEKVDYEKLPSIDRESVYCMIYVKLYDLYKFKGNLEKSKKYYELAIKEIHEQNKYQGIPMVRRPEEEIKAILKDIYQHEDPKWRAL